MLAKKWQNKKVGKLVSSRRATTSLDVKATGVENKRKKGFRSEPVVIVCIVRSSAASEYTCFHPRKGMALPQGSLLLLSGIRENVHTVIFPRQTIQVRIAWKRSLRTGRGAPSATCTHQGTRLDFFRKGWHRYGVLGRAPGHPPATKPGWFGTIRRCTHPKSGKSSRGWETYNLLLQMVTIHAFLKHTVMTCSSYVSFYPVLFCRTNILWRYLLVRHPV